MGPNANVLFFLFLLSFKKCISITQSYIVVNYYLRPSNGLPQTSLMCLQRDWCRTACLW